MAEQFTFKMVHCTPCYVTLLIISLFMLISRTTAYERIVTDLNDVYRGVPVDYRYNESDTSSVPLAGGKLSVPGCPKSVEGYPWVYYGSPKKCYLAGEKGPCAPEQKLFIEPGSPYGFCNCECFEGMNRRKGADEVEFCMEDNREHAFVSAKKKCYTLYDQGPCKNNEWLVKSLNKNRRNVTLCESRKCPGGQIPYFDGETDAGHNSNNFSCYSPITAFAGPVSIIPHNCESDGLKYSKLLKKCVKKFGFSFG